MDNITKQLKMVFDLMASDEFTDSVATFMWKLYRKLIDKGFTDDQAIKIVTNFNSNKK